jgi:hypothetical protein
MKLRDALLSIPRATTRLPGGALVNCFTRPGGPTNNSVGSAGMRFRITCRPTKGSSFQVLNAVRPTHRVPALSSPTMPTEMGNHPASSAPA